MPEAVHATPDTHDTTAGVPVGPAFGVWLPAFLLSSVASVLVIGAFGVDGDDYTVPQLGLALVAGWIVFLVGVRIASDRFASGDLVRDYGLRIAPVDAAAVVAGVAAQLVLVPVLYIPLRHWWPETFAQSKLDERAQELVDKAGGFQTVLLAVLLVIGAPFVEELVYRGLLQRSMARHVGRAGAVLLVSAVFALVHPSPVEYPGLFVAGLVFGSCAAVTGRLGTSMLAHAAFNATALVVVLR